MGHFQEGRQAYVLQRFYGRDVIRATQGRAHQDRAVEFLVVVGRFVGWVGPVGELGGHVHDQGS